MKPNALLRTATLSLFIVLMSGFVAYKAGAFESDGNAIAGNADSPKKDSAAPAVMAPSTKSAVIFEPQTASDSSRSKAVQQQNTSPAPKPNNVYMGSSKSAPVFTPTTDTSKPK